VGLTGTETYAEILELVARGDVLVKERLRLRERNPARKVLHLPRVKKDACVRAAARLRARTETGSGSQVQVPLQMLWILIGERRDALKYAKC
jgi:hypothetical protein